MADVVDPRSASITNSLDCWVTRRRWRDRYPSCLRRTVGRVLPAVGHLRRMHRCQSGAVAVLKNLDGDGPEAAADLTTVVSGMAVILAVNRADKLEVAMYVQGEAGQSFAPPVLFTSTPRFVEDLMLGIVTLNQLKTQGFEVVDSADSTMIRRCRFSPTTLGADVAGAAPASNRRQPNQ